MEQLKMYWKAEPSKWPEMPEGWRWRYFTGGEEDVQTWLKLCTNGLLDENNSREMYEALIVRHGGIDPTKQIFILEKDGVPMATITTPMKENHTGWLHMVCALPEARGIGIGNLLCEIGKASLWEMGCRQAFLTTNEFRVAAVKSYLKAGFLPVEYSYDMPERWEPLLKYMQRWNVPMVDENGRQTRVLAVKE